MAMTASSISGGHSSSQLTRTLERVCEDAQITGELKLSGRKLKEFLKIASKYDLSDTVSADLSKNRFSEVPSEVCEFFLLERLDCYHNVIRSIPDSVITLQSLTYLNLSRNQLLTVPPSLCQLPLQVLILGNNKLVSLPEEIGHMQCLMDLDVSCNEISILPPQIGDLQCLRTLIVRRNLLVELPPELCELRLTRLDISANRISSLPTQLRLMLTLQELVLDHNPLTSPPAFLCTRGRVHIFKFLEIQAIKDEKKRGALLESDFRRSFRKPSLLADLRLQNGFTPDSRRKRCTLDSGYNTSDGGDKRRSQELQELNSDLEETQKLALRTAELIKHQRQERGRDRNSNSSDGTLAYSTSSSSSSSTFLSQSSMDHNDSPTSLINGPQKIIPKKYINEFNPENYSDSLHKEIWEEQNIDRSEENSHSKMMNSGEYSNGDEDKQDNSSLGEGKRPYPHIQTYKEFKEALKMQRSCDNNVYRRTSMVDGSVCPSSPKLESPRPELATSQTVTSNNHMTPEEEFRVRHEALLSQHRFEAALLQRRLEEEKTKIKPQQKEVTKPLLKPCSSPLRVFEHSENAENKSNGQHVSLIHGCNGTGSSPKLKRVGQSVNPNFTMRRELDKAREEQELLAYLREVLETRLKVTLPKDLGPSLTDGVFLCHLANHLRPNSVACIHVPSPAVPNLTMAKCRRNVENFLEACRLVGVPNSLLCSSQDILEERGGLVRVAITVQELVRAITKTHHT